MEEKLGELDLLFQAGWGNELSSVWLVHSLGWVLVAGQAFEAVLTCG